MGAFLSNTDQLPEQVLASPAICARTTAEIAADAGEWSTPILIEERLYEASVRVVFEVLRRLDADAGRVLVVGHEPTCSGVISALTGGGVLRMPTAAIARIDLAVERWEELDAGVGTLRWLLPPRLLAGRG